ncbi:PAS domain S-box protein [Patescibacteria group bacterium]|nr:PAS domain S-box protein [Patescibacteria group bacterium]
MPNKTPSNNILENLDLVIENLNEGVIIINLSGKILKVNRTLLEIGHYKRSDLEGKNAMKLVKIFPLKSLKKIIASFTHAAKGYSADRYRVEAKTKEGNKRIIELSTSLIEKNNKAIGIAVVVRDVTMILEYRKFNKK